jgi:GDP-4-dehydro-6-deoxy-D-mannose reductase
MRVLVTGAAGFTGTRMMNYLLQQEGVTTVGLVHRIPGRHAELSRTSSVAADLLDREGLITAVAGVHPDAIIHLAGLTRGPLDAMLLANVAGTKNILDAGYTANPDCRVLVVSSSAVYGDPSPGPIPESASLHPLSEYGVSKMAQDALALMYHELNDLPVSVARPFNLIGPGQEDIFICGRIAGQVAKILQQKQAALELRETRSSRDLVDVRDVVKGYWAIISHPDFSRDCAGQAFNLGSGISRQVSEIIATMEEITGRNFEVILPETPASIPIHYQQGDNSRITSLTGWKPEISFKDSLQDMLAEASRQK